MKYNTKQETVDLMYDLLNPLKSLYSKDGEKYEIFSFEATESGKTVEDEKVSYPIWSLLPYWMSGEDNKQFDELYKKSIELGMNPENKEFWGNYEMQKVCSFGVVAIALGILKTPQKTWEILEKTEKENLAKWFNKCTKELAGEKTLYVFRILVNLALQNVDMPYDELQMEADLQLLDSYCAEEHWYKKGGNDHDGYYNPWHMHYYSVYYTMNAKKGDPKRCAYYRKRAEEFAKQFIYWFDVNGASVPFGKSLNHRFAQCAFWSICVSADINVFPIGVLKGLINRNFEWWMDKEIFNLDGTLNVGYCHPQISVLENDNSPALPFWALKAFSHLSLDENHEFWKVQEEPMPNTPGIKEFKCADLLMQRLYDGQVNAFAVGNVPKTYDDEQMDAYSKFVYNTRFGVSTAIGNKSFVAAAPDCMLAFEIDGNIFVRKASLEFEISENCTYSRWSPCPGIEVESTIYPREIDHLRRHVIKSDIECVACDCGFAIENCTSKFSLEDGIGGATAQNESVGCSVIGHGLGVNIVAFPNTNLYHANTVIPAVKYLVQKGETVIETIVESWCM